MSYHVDKLNWWIQTTVPQVYTEDMSYYELLTSVMNKLNEVIDDTNAYFNKDLKVYVGDILQGWYDDGTLATIINQDVFSMKADKTYVDGQVQNLNTSITTLQAEDTTLDSKILELAKVSSSQSNVWQRKGNIFSGIEQGAEPTVIVDGNSHLFPGASQVFKMWYRYGASSDTDNNGEIRYAESLDGIHFTPYGTVIPHEPNKNPSGPYVVKTLDGKYVLFAHHAATYDGYIYRWDSYDGISWAKNPNPVLASTGAGWDGSMLGNLCVWQDGPYDWRMIYEAAGTDTIWHLGYATSSDGISWTKFAGNPVISNVSGGGPDVHKVNGLYYMWFHAGNMPTEVFRASSENLTSWDIPAFNPVIRRKTLDEGVLEPEGQLSDPNIVEFNGKTYLYYEAVETQSKHRGLRVMVADGTLSEIVNTLENSEYTPAVGCVLMCDYNQTLTSGVGKELEFDVKQYDPLNMFLPFINASRVNIKQTGYYLIEGNVRFAANNAGIRDLVILVNGTPVAYQDQNPIPDNVMGMSVQTVKYLTVGDFVSIQAYQTSGAAVNLEFVANAAPRFSVMKIG
jgi:hypothetical protein